ncbi:MAG: transcription termination factor NusA, partial [Acetanaerobacterium sp.]
MSNEFFDALNLLEKEKGIPAEYLIEKIKNAILNAVKRDYGASDNVIVEIDPDQGAFSVAIRKEVVEEVENPATQIQIEEAKKHAKRGKLDEYVDVLLETKQFGRIAAQTAKHIIRQGIREAERGQMYQDFQSKHHEIVTAVVLKLDPRKGSATLEIGRNEAMLPKSEMVPGEMLREGDRVKVYVVNVENTEKGPRVMISRTHPGLVKRLFEMEVPEIYDGTVEIRAVSREAGSRTKIAVFSKDENVDPVGACIGPKGTRVSRIVDELGGEKIDVVKFSETPEEFIAEALSPADVVRVEVIDEIARSCHATVPDNQLSLAIGNKGQNARLAARLT